MPTTCFICNRDYQRPVRFEDKVDEFIDKYCDFCPECLKTYKSENKDLVEKIKQYLKMNDTINEQFIKYIQIMEENGRVYSCNEKREIYNREAKDAIELFSEIKAELKKDV